MLKRDYNLERKEENFTTVKKLPDGGKVVEHYVVKEATPGVAVGYKNRMAKGFRLSTSGGSAETGEGMFDAQPWVVSQCCFKVRVETYDSANNLTGTTPLEKPVPVSMRTVVEEWVTPLVNDLFNWIEENSNLNNESQESTISKLCVEFGIDRELPEKRQLLKEKLQEYIVSLDVDEDEEDAKK